jgi:hypothetical protein
VTKLAAITTQPSAFQVCEDQPISISGAGSDTASHQWLFNGSPISAPNGTRQTYTKGGSPATMADSGMYRLVVLSANAGATVCKADTSIAVLGAVVRKIAITTQPLAKTFVCQNSAFNAGITAQNVTSYQWKKGGTNVSIGTGGTTANYSIASTHPADAGIYSLEMVGISPCPNVTSTNDTLQVTTLAAITSPPASGTVVCETQGFTLNTAATNAASYQWLRNGSVVSGATGKTFTLSASDVGRNISVRVTGTKSGYSSATQTSAETIAVLAIPTFTNSSVPTIAGSAVVGQTLAASITGWSPEPEGVSFLWYVSPSTVPSGWGPSYTIKPSDLGKKITVRAIASRSGLNSLTLTSSPTESVADAAPIESIPEATITTSRESTITSSRLESSTKPSATGNSYFDEYLFEAIYRRIGLQNHLQPFAGD